MIRPLTYTSANTYFSWKLTSVFLRKKLSDTMSLYLKCVKILFEENQASVFPG